MIRLFFFILFPFLFLPFLLNGQNISATYAITKELVVNSSNKTMSLALTGHYYKEGNKYIYWEHPDFLAKYPDGKISFSEGNNIHEYALTTDTVQMLFYHDYDNYITRSGLFNENQRAITEYPFVHDITDPWVYGTETKVINGLKCQLATFPTQWRVWFCADIPAKTSLRGSHGLPGLIVEADCLPTNDHFTLLVYDMGAKIDAKVFTPDVFKQPMGKGPLLKSYKPTDAKTKAEKLQELLNQN